MKLLPFILTVLCLFSCMTVDITIRDSAAGGAPKSVLIGNLDNRVLEFNPFIVKNFRDSLSYELFSRGLAVRLLESGDTDKEGAIPGSPAENRIPEILQKNPADLFIQGSIFEARYGDAIDDRTSTAVVLSLYNKNGEKIGTARCITSDTLADMEVIRALSAKLVRAINARLAR